MRILILAIGRIRPPFADDAQHYEKLLSRYARLETVELKEAGGDPARAAELMRAEAAALERRIPGDAHLVALERSGRQLSSEQLSAWLEQRRTAGRDLCFLIGGPLGLDPALAARADLALSLGAPTLPHQLARVVLLEQLYRAHKILAREPYHL